MPSSPSATASLVSLEKRSAKSRLFQNQATSRASGVKAARAEDLAQASDLLEQKIDCCPENVRDAWTNTTVHLSFHPYPIQQRYLAHSSPCHSEHADAVAPSKTLDLFLNGLLIGLLPMLGMHSDRVLGGSLHRGSFCRSPRWYGTRIKRTPKGTPILIRELPL